MQYSLCPSSCYSIPICPLLVVALYRQLLSTSTFFLPFSAVHPSIFQISICIISNMVFHFICCHALLHDFKGLLVGCYHSPITCSCNGGRCQPFSVSAVCHSNRISPECINLFALSFQKHFRRTLLSFATSGIISLRTWSEERNARWHLVTADIISASSSSTLFS